MASLENQDFYDDEDEIIYQARENSLEKTESELESSQEVERNYLPKCTICYRKFNTVNRVPYVISVCGHSVCSECLSKIDVCPICRKDIDETVINWAINSELDSVNISSYEPFYKIFVDFKNEIESDYLRYPDTSSNVEFADLTSSQKRLINKIKFRIKDIEILDHMFDNLLIPKWIKNHIIKANNQICSYKSRLEYFGLQRLEELLPFCP